MAAALLLSFSAAAVLLLARRDALAGLVLDALDRFHLDGRSLLDLATKRNMVLLCHAILLLILRDAGLLGAPARRRAASSATTTSSLVVAAAATAVDDNEEAAICSAPARPRAATTATATSVVVWRRPRSSARDGASADESGRRLARRRQPRPQPAAIPSRAEPALSAGPEQHPPLTMISKGIVLVETKAPGNYHLGGGHDRAAAVVGLDHQAAGAACATTTDANKSDYDDRRIVAVSDHDGNANAGTEQTEEEEEVELADDRRIEEFIAKQWSKMRQESLQLRLVRSSSGSSSLQQAITAC